MRRNLHNFQKGFTLIELIVVIGIISILAAGVLTTLNPVTQFQKADDARRKSDLSQIQKALETYYQDAGSYPPSNSSYQLPVPWGQSWQPYMNVLPGDPSSANKYIYFSPVGGQAYYLYASLGRGGSDPQACFSNGSSCSNVPVGASCGGTCNFGLSSPNVSP